MSPNILIPALFIYPVVYLLVLNLNPVRFQWGFRRGLPPMPPEMQARAEDADLRAIGFQRRAVSMALVTAMTLAQGTSAVPNLKIVIKTTNAGFPALGEETIITYVQNDRKRIEERRQSPQSLQPGGSVVFLPGPRIATITRCDLDQLFVPNLDDREYMSMPVPKRPSREELQARAVQRPKPAVPPQPTLLIETITNDTGERKEMFGYTARHVITTQRQTLLVESGQRSPENVTDGWYVDLDAAVPCDIPTSGVTFAVLTRGTRKPGEPPQIPVPTFRSFGKPERGFALATKQFFRANISSPDRPAQITESLTRETQVTELSTTPLDPALFEVPGNFRKVPQIRRLPVVHFWTRWLGWLAYYWTRLKRTI